MSVADAIARKNFKRAVEAEKNRTTHVPSLASRESAKISADDIIDATFFLRRNGRALRCDAKKYGHDCWRLFGPVEGWDVYCEVCSAARYDYDDETDLDAEWLSFNRERVSTDLFLIDFCEEVYRRRDELIDCDDENPEPLKLSMALMAEIERLTDEAEQFLADEIAVDKAECDAREAAWEAEDQSEHAEMIAAGSVVSMAEYRKMKSQRDIPTPTELVMRKLDDAERRLAKAKNKVTQARGAAETNAAIKERVAAQENVDATKEAAHAVQANDKEWDTRMAKVNARAAEIKADVLAAVTASRPKYPPPNNAGPIPVPSNTVRMPMIGNGMAITPSEFIASDSEEALATLYVGRYSNRLRYVAGWGKWHEWNGERWIPDDTLHSFDLARGICREVAGSFETKVGKPIASAKTVAAVERLAKSDRNIAATVDQWDCDPWLLNTPGGVVDLRTGELRAACPDDYMTKITAVAPGGECPIFLAFLRRVTGDDNELAKYLQRVLGYSLTGITREHAMFFLYGTGANGKSVLLGTIAGIMGDYHTTAPMETFTASATERHPTDLAGLRGARLVTAIETEEGRRWAESKIKSLTGGDKVSARFMRQDFFEFTPQFKFMPAGNHKPGLRSVDEAIRRRFHLIPFAVTIPPAERDPDLAEKLKAEWPGILAWLIEGCRLWQQDGLQVPKAVEAATAAYLESEDAHAAWIEERCERDSAAWTSTAQLFASWSAWASAAGEFVGSSRRFLGAMEAHGFEAARPKNERGFRGIKLRPMFGTMPLPPSPRE